MPDWADVRPFKEFEDLKLKEWEAHRIAALKGDRRISFWLGLAVGIAYATMLMYIEKIPAFLTRSMRSLAGLRPRT